MENRSCALEAMRWLFSQYAWPNDVMYHYTSKVAVENILATRKMWATDLRAMNDPRELLHGREVLDQRIKALLRKSPGRSREIFLRTVQKLFLSVISRASSCFSISFSERPDLPHQWRDYAADGHGFALGWSIDSQCPEIPLRMWVAYDRQLQRKVLDGLINFHFTWITGVIADGVRQPDEAWLEGARSLARFMEVVVQTFKTRKWSIESEFRYVYRFFDGYEPAGQIIKQRNVCGTEKRYIEADFSQVELRRVIVGPRNDLEPTLVWLREILDRSGYLQTAIALPTVSSADLDAGSFPTLERRS